MHHWMSRSVEGSDIETCKFAFDLSLDLNFGKKIPVMRMFLVLKVAWKFKAIRFEYFFYLFKESTYGTHIHENRDEREKRFTSKQIILTITKYISRI